MWMKRNHTTFQTILFITHFCPRLQQHKTLSDATQCTYSTVNNARGTKVTVAQILSRGPRITTTHKKRNRNLTHSYMDTNIGTNTIQELKHSLRVSWTVVVLGRTVAFPRHRPQTWTLDFSVVRSTFSPDRAGDLAWRICVRVIYEQWTHRGPRSKHSSDGVPEVLAGETGLVAQLLFNPGRERDDSLVNWTNLQPLQYCASEEWWTHN